MSRIRSSLVLFVAAGLLLDPRIGVAAGPPCLRPPVVAPVADPFRAPPCPYCAGNRGIEYVSIAGSAVIAPADGRVTFAGAVAGVRYVVIEHGGGYRTTLGRLATVEVGVGQRVAAGSSVGTAADLLFFGLRLGDQYVDPGPHLARLVARPQLVPLDGERRRPPWAGRLVCP